MNEKQQNPNISAKAEENKLPQSLRRAGFKAADTRTADGFKKHLLAMNMGEQLWQQMRAESQRPEQQGQPVLIGSFGWKQLQAGGHVQMPERLMACRLAHDLDFGYYDEDISGLRPSQRSTFPIIQQAAGAIDMDATYFAANAREFIKQIPVKGRVSAEEQNKQFNFKGKSIPQYIHGGTKTQVIARNFYPELWLSKSFTTNETKTILTANSSTAGIQSPGKNFAAVKIEAIPDNAYFLPPMKFSDDKGEFYHDHLLQALAVKTVRGLRGHGNNNNWKLTKPADMLDVAILKDTKIRTSGSEEFTPLYDENNPGTKKLLRLLIVLTASFENSRYEPGERKFPTKLDIGYNIENLKKTMQHYHQQRAQTAFNNQEAADLLQETQAFLNNILPARQQQNGNQKSETLLDRFTENERKFYNAIRHPEQSKTQNRTQYILNAVNEYLVPEYNDVFEANPGLKTRIPVHPLMQNALEKAITFGGKEPEQQHQSGQWEHGDSDDDSIPENLSHSPEITASNPQLGQGKDLSLPPGGTNWGQRFASANQKPAGQNNGRT